MEMMSDSHVVRKYVPLLPKISPGRPFSIKIRNPNESCSEPVFEPSLHQGSRSPYGHNHINDNTFFSYSQDTELSRKFDNVAEYTSPNRITIPPRKVAKSPLKPAARTSSGSIPKVKIKLSKQQPSENLSDFQEAETCVAYEPREQSGSPRKKRYLATDDPSCTSRSPSLMVVISTKTGTCRITHKHGADYNNYAEPLPVTNNPSEICENSSIQAIPKSQGSVMRIKRIRFKSKAVSSPVISKMQAPSSPGRMMSVGATLLDDAAPSLVRRPLRVKVRLNTPPQPPLSLPAMEKVPSNDMPAMNDMMYRSTVAVQVDTQEDSVQNKENVPVGPNTQHNEVASIPKSKPQLLKSTETDEFCYCKECTSTRTDTLPPVDISKLRQASDDVILREMEAAEDSMNPEFKSGYYLVNKAGFGAFSSVFAAIDLKYHHCSRDWDVFNNNERTTASRKNNSLHFVAIKMIRGGSSPARIQNELELLRDLRGNRNVISLITADRREDNVFVVLPYCSQTPIKEIYDNLSPKVLKNYMHELLLALSFVHSQGIIHRDIKSTNFLYSMKTGRGVLADFGLAERERDNYKSCECQRGGLSMRDYYGLTKQGGYYLDDPRPHRYASRVGTRGFRAPEVLLKCGAQDTRLDMWSAGVLLVSLLSGRLCFFRAEEDREGLIEQAVLFGARRMRKCAILHGSVFESNVPSITEEGFPLEDVISRCRRDEQIVDQYKEAIELAKRLLELDVRKRYTANKALRHPFMALSP